jgi:hypothetical protein
MLQSGVSGTGSGGWWCSYQARASIRPCTNVMSSFSSVWVCEGVPTIAATWHWFEVPPQNGRSELLNSTPAPKRASTLYQSFHYLGASSTSCNLMTPPSLRQRVSENYAVCAHNYLWAILSVSFWEIVCTDARHTAREQGVWQACGCCASSYLLNHGIDDEWVF